MTEHELTDEKIEELWNEELWNASKRIVVCFDNLVEPSKATFRSFARTAYDLGKQAPDGFLPCTFDDIRKGDTVERTIEYDGATEVLTGVASSRDRDGDWATNAGTILTIRHRAAAYTYRRKPAEVTPPDPQKHPVILDGDGEAWVRDGAVYVRPSNRFTAFTPDNFGNDWTPAKVVAKEED